MAQKTRAQLQAQINSLLATNTAGDISATDVRTVDGDNIDSNLNLSDGGEMSGAITGNIAITGFRPIISTTSATINLANGTHEGTFIYSNLGTAVTVNIRDNATEAFPVGTEIDIIQAGAGVVTLTPATGVNLNGLNTAIAITAQWGGVTLKQITDNNWIAIGKI